MIDIGANLTNRRFSDDLVAVIARAKNVGLSKILVTGTSVAESQKALSLCHQFPDFLACTAGVHPHDADNVGADYLEALAALAAHDEVKAIGECGLDFNRNFSSPQKQVDVFKAQIALAAQLNRPLFLHQRDAFSTWFELLSAVADRVPAMVSHCFTGNKAELLQCLDIGMYIGITGWVCDERRGQALKDIVSLIPLDRLMIETDAPYLTPRHMKPRPKDGRNEPSFLPYVVQVLSEAMGYSEQEIIHQSSLNAVRVFNLK